MANIFGAERIVSNGEGSVVLTGLAFGIPMFINPTQDQLKSMGFENAKEPIYDFSKDGKPQTKIDIWLKIPYREEEVGISQIIADDTKYKYTTFTLWSYFDENVYEKGAFKVSPASCKNEWWPDNDRTQVKYPKFPPNDPGIKTGVGREREVYGFIDTWLSLDVTKSLYNITTPFTSMLKGNWKEINEMFKANLTRTDRAPRGVKVLLGAREHEGNVYQDVYTGVVLGENVTNPNSLIRELNRTANTAYAWNAQDKSTGNNFTFKKYEAPQMPAQNIDPTETMKDDLPF